MLHDASLSDDHHFRGKIRKLLVSRLILAVLLLLLTLAVSSSREEDLLASHLHPLYFFSSVLFAFTIVGAWGLDRVKRLAWFAWGQLLFDIGAVTALIYISGGVGSHFSFLYTLVIIASALLLHRRGSILTASACSFVYGLLLDLQYFGWLSPLQIVTAPEYARDSETYFYTILTNITGFYLVAFLAGTLAAELQRSSRQVKEHERDLRKLSSLHKSIVQSMPSGLLTVDAEEKIAFLNIAGYEVLGVKGVSLEGRPVKDILPELQFEQVEGSITDPEPSSRPFRLETCYKRPSGEEIHLGYSISVLQTQTGKPFGWIVNFRDITKLKAIEEDMQRNERLVFAGRIASEIAHEIKNPLAAMSGAVQMLQGEMGQNAFQIKLMGIVEREIGRINELVTDFLWLAKGSPKSANNIQDVQVCSTIQDILSLLKAKSRVTESHTLKTDFIAFPVITIDPHHLRQIMWNLFINALEAMPEGGQLSTSVTLPQSGENGRDEIRIDIADTGGGMPEEVSKRIFDPFYTTKASGTGLGLSIVYQLVEKAGGRIEAHPNQHGTGTTFSVFFPPANHFSLAKQPRDD